MNIILADYNRTNLLPFTFMRPVAAIRCGILTIAEKWEKLSNQPCSFLTETYLSSKFALKVSSENIVANGAVLINEKLFSEIMTLEKGQALVKGDLVIAVMTSAGNIKNFGQLDYDETIETDLEVDVLNYPWDIFKLNDKAISDDFSLLTQNRKSASADDSNTLINASQIFIEESAKVQCAVINASAGPVYIGPHAEVMEGALIRGPFALCEHATLKMGAKVYGATTIGPHCKVGGEVSNSVIFGYSNKAHDGFLGNSVVAEWCNLGADTNNSNLKNNYGIVKCYNYGKKDYISTGLQFCGLMMADHSKAAINTMFNTGTVVGVAANVFGGGFPPKYIPSFAWGGFNDEQFQLDKAIELAREVYKRRNLAFDKTEESILNHVNGLELILPSE
ncbi:MAG: GlmU family protein [Bacteroidetes bacterium]|jgi:UDP-N-acetylglucosamine diphosphorylase/glucosamine-1-phosphate N-acetyltransferase|nr:GlmU family protein [Bacteroidota bacterium]